MDGFTEEAEPSTTDQLDALQAVLRNVDRILRERLAEIGIGFSHVLAAVEPDGSIVVHGNILPAALKVVGAELIDIAEDELQQLEEEEQLL